MHMGVSEAKKKKHVCFRGACAPPCCHQCCRTVHGRGGAIRSACHGAQLPPAAARRLQLRLYVVTHGLTLCARCHSWWLGGDMRVLAAHYPLSTAVL